MGLGPGTEGRERPELTGVQLGRAGQEGALHGGVYVGHQARQVERKASSQGPWILELKSLSPLPLGLRSDHICRREPCPKGLDLSVWGGARREGLLLFLSCLHPSSSVSGGFLSLELPEGE